VALGGVSTRGHVVEEVEAVLLDALGTLVALQPPAPALVAELQARHSVEVALADAERALGAEIAYYRAHHDEGRDPATLAGLRRRCAEVLRAALPADVGAALTSAQWTAALLAALRFTALPDGPAALAALRARGVTLVVVSNWDASLPAVLDTVGLTEAVDGVVTSAAVGCPKPGRAIFDAALALAGCPAHAAVHVGDSVAYDVHGALAAGVRPVLLRRASAAPQGPPPGVPTISSLTELLALGPIPIGPKLARWSPPR
jgi:putative hydrolase of the HAD superfamily